VKRRSTWVKGERLHLFQATALPQVVTQDVHRSNNLYSNLYLNNIFTQIEIEIINDILYVFV
jgi:hypothetical protein